MTELTPRMHELLAIEAIEGLDFDEAAELERLLVSAPPGSRDRYERAAAAIHLASMVSSEAMPEALRNRLVRAGRDFIKSRR